MPTLGAGVLLVDADRLVAAAGALDALVDEFHIAVLSEAAADSGQHEMTAALDEFWLAWANGLAQMLGRQRSHADGLRRAVEAYTGRDADAAYQLRSAIGTL